MVIIDQWVMTHTLYTLQLAQLSPHPISIQRSTMSSISKRDEQEGAVSAECMGHTPKKNY